MPIKEGKCKITIGNENLERRGHDCKPKFFKFVGIKLDEDLT